ncbi:MAG: porin [Undibacterium sp.]|nr:porin [Undibacterium sp.]
MKNSKQLLVGVIGSIFCATASISQAQSSANTNTGVSIFGELDVSIANIKTPGTPSVNALASGLGNQSHIGFRGIESLGSGVSAFFILDSFIAVDTGSSTPNLWGRESSVGIKSEMGSIALGRNSSPIFDAAVENNVFGNARLAPLFGAIGFATSHALNSAQDNSIRYRLPALQGFGGGFLYRVKESSGSEYWTADLNYTTGASKMSIAVDHSKPDLLAGELTSVLASLNHDFGNFRLYGNLLSQRDSTAQQKARGADVGLLLPWSPQRAFKFAFAYGEKSKLDNTAKQHISVFGFAHEYYFSKRTTLYIMRQQQKFSQLPSGSSMTLGMTHKF